MKTIDIKGKPYVTVNERLKYFREQDAFKGWQIITTIINADSDVCLMKAEVINDLGIVIATGHAYEETQSTFINKTSHVENCETSCIGRALGNTGIGIDDSVASFEEVANAIKQQEDTRSWMTQARFAQIVKQLNETKDPVARKKIVEIEYAKFKVRKSYRSQLNELVTTPDIPGL